jgi:hypothetical protein
VTHPHHPLFGQEFDLVACRHTWGEHRVFFRDEQNRLRSFPAAWTSVVAPEPFVEASAGRSLFRIDDMLTLAALLRELSERNGTGVATLKADCEVRKC